jgi:hybrid cluster-associated redox disulfide protein
VKEPSVTDILHTPIAIILNCYPQVSQVFIRNRMGCIGCAFSRFHTLKDAIEIYKLDEETFFGEVWDLLDARYGPGASKPWADGAAGWGEILGR